MTKHGSAPRIEMSAISPSSPVRAIVELIGMGCVNFVDISQTGCVKVDERGSSVRSSLLRYELLFMQAIYYVI